MINMIDTCVIITTVWIHVTISLYLEQSVYLVQQIINSMLEIFFVTTASIKNLSIICWSSRHVRARTDGAAATLFLDAASEEEG